MRAFARHGPPTRRRSCSADAAREPRGSAGEGGRRCDAPPFLCQPGEERGGCPRAGALPLPACGPSLQRLASGRLGEAILHLVFPMPGGLAASGPGVRAGVQPPAHVPRFCPSGWTPDELRNRQCWRHNGAGCAPSKSVELAPGEAGAGAARRSVGREEPQGRGAPGQRAGGGVLGRARSGCRNGVAEGWRLSTGCRLQADGTHPALPHFWARGLGAVWMGTSVPRDTLPENKPGTQRKDQRRVTWRGRADGGRARGHPKAGRGLQGMVGRAAGEGEEGGLVAGW